MLVKQPQILYMGSLLVWLLLIIQQKVTLSSLSLSTVFKIANRISPPDTHARTRTHTRTHAHTHARAHTHTHLYHCLHSTLLLSEIILFICWLFLLKRESRDSRNLLFMFSVFQSLWISNWHSWHSVLSMVCLKMTKSPLLLG